MDIHSEVGSSLFILFCFDKNDVVLPGDCCVEVCDADAKVAMG